MLYATDMIVMRLCDELKSSAYGSKFVFVCSLVIFYFNENLCKVSGVFLLIILTFSVCWGKCFVDKMSYCLLFVDS